MPVDTAVGVYDGFVISLTIRSANPYKTVELRGMITTTTATLEGSENA